MRTTNEFESLNNNFNIIQYLKEVDPKNGYRVYEMDGREIECKKCGSTDVIQKEIRVGCGCANKKKYYLRCTKCGTMVRIKNPINLQKT